MTQFSDGIRVGDAYYGRAVGSQPAGRQDRGAAISPIQIYSATPATLDADGIAAAQAVAGAGNLTLNGALASGGSVTFDVPRAVQIASSNAGDTTQTATFTGTDVYGAALVQTLTFNGTNAVSGTKAFKTITSVAISAALAGNATAGSTDIFGLPFRANNRSAVLTAWNSAFVTTGTFTAAVTTSPATATTGDVRGTYAPPDAANGTKTLRLWIFLEDVDTKNGLYGVDQYGG